MNKIFTFLLTSAALVAGGTSVAVGATVPWLETFETDDSFGQFTTINANGDNKEWEYSDGYKCVMIRYNADLAMDDWLITPGFPLEAGAVYKFQIDARNSMGAEQFEVFAGTAPTAEAMTISVIEKTAVTKSSYTTFSGQFKAPETGMFYIGVHGCSDADKLYLYVDNLQLTQGLDENSPEAVTDLQVVPDVNGEARVSVSGVLPEIKLSGDKLTSISRLEIICDNTVAGTYSNLTPGEKFSFTHEGAPVGRHTYTVVAYDGSSRGREAAAEVFVGPNVPGTVRNPKVGELSPGKVTLRWECPDKDVDGNPINPDLITYKVVRFEIMDNSLFIEEDIEGADGIKETEYVHTAINPGEGQMYTAYGVYAMTSAGKSKRVDTPLFPVGDSYETPFKESFEGGAAITLFRSETIKNYQTVPTWDAMNDVDSEVKSRDDDFGYLVMMGEHEDDCARFYSGKVSLDGLQKPMLSFYVYNFYNGSNSRDKNILEVYVSDGTRFTFQKEIVVDDLPDSGWNRVNIPLDDFVGKTIQFAFQGTIKNYMVTAVDCITIADAVDSDLDAVRVNVPERIVAGRAFNVTVTVENSGVQGAAGYNVELYRDGEMVQTLGGPDLDPCAVAEVTFSDMISVMNEGDCTYYAKVVFEGDAVADNDVTPDVTVKVEMPKHPVPTALAGEHADGVVTLSWTAPDFSSALPEAVTDDFEIYESFTTTDAGGWIFTDADGCQVGKLDLYFPGITYEGSVQSFWVMDATFEGANSLYAAHSGNKYLAQIFNAGDLPCDDWAISPALYEGGQTVSFYAKSYSSYATLAEQFEVLYSTGSTDIADFTLLAKVDAVPNAWTRYEYNLPEGAARFAIRCTSEGRYMLFVDDVTYIPANGSVALELAGYNVYRNGQKVNDAVVAEEAYTDAAAPNGTHSYVVTAVYDKGESLPSEEFVATVSGLESVAGADAVSVRGGNGEIVIETSADLHVVIVTPDGKTVASADVTAPSARFDVVPAVYLVKAGTQTFKVVVR